jgi:hypothetical protein
MLVDGYKLSIVARRPLACKISEVRRLFIGVSLRPEGQSSQFACDDIEWIQFGTNLTSKQAAFCVMGLHGHFPV